jgi:hypothetical protein
MKKKKILAGAAVFLTAVYLIFMYNVLQDNKIGKIYEVWYTEQGEVLGYNITFKHNNEVIYYFIDSNAMTTLL